MNNNDTDEKRERWLQYGFWIFAALIAVAAIFILINVTSAESGLNVPSGYKFIIEDHHPKSDNTWATYYVYDDYVLVQKDSVAAKDEPLMIYDGIDTSKLNYDENDTTKVCDADSCYHYPKALTTLKKLISKKSGREYIRR